MTASCSLDEHPCCKRSVNMMTVPLCASWNTRTGAVNALVNGLGPGYILLNSVLRLLMELGNMQLSSINPIQTPGAMAARHRLKLDIT